MARVLALLVLALAPACSGPARTQGAPRAATPIERPAEAAPPAVAPRVAPATLPAVPPEAPAPTAEPPRDTPAAPGRVAELVAVDRERAVVRFLVPGEDWWRRWWIALMRRDGTVSWVRALSGELGEGESSIGLAVVGDTVSVVTYAVGAAEPRVTLQAFALSDGAPRTRVGLGRGFPDSTLTDGERRYDTVSGDAASEIVATSGAGVVWRARIGRPPPTGHDPTLVGDAVVVRSSDNFGSSVVWTVFERRTGRIVGRLPSLPQSCSDGTRWMVRTAAGLVAVDARTLSTRLVTADGELLGAGHGTWSIEDCSFADGTPVALVARGHRRALVALDFTTGTVRGSVELGSAAVGANGFDPLPTRLHAAAVLKTLRDDGVGELVVAEPQAGRILGRWVSAESELPASSMVPVARGTFLATQHTVAIVDRATGELGGLAMTSEVRVEPWQIAGNTVWLPPLEPFRLGRRAPRQIDLAAVVHADVRDAVLADLSPPPEVNRPGGRPPCPDPRTVVRGDGLGVPSAPLGPVAPGRLPPWDLDVLHETARQYACAPGSATSRLLAWYVMEDDRPLRNDNALLLVEDVAARPPRFTLVETYRHSVNREWNIDASFHSQTEPVRTFDHRPTHAEIDAFLAQAGWTFADGWGRVIAGNVVDAEWRAATGEPPWHSFARGIEQPE